MNEPKIQGGRDKNDGKAMRRRMWVLVLGQMHGPMQMGKIQYLGYRGKG